MFLLIWHKILLDTIGQTLYFPIWWYSGGVRYFFNRCYGIFLFGNTYLMPGLWLKNIFVPMYGQYDIQGRIISFIMRLVQVIARSIGLLIWLIVCLILFVVCLLLPIAAIMGMIRALI